MIYKDIAEYEETDSKLAKDTIFNLHSEIDRLKESEEYHRKGFAELHKRIDEAIEYIKENKSHHECNEYCFDNMLEDTIELENILQGSDNNGK